MFGYFENKVTELYKTIAPEETPEEKFLSAIASGDLKHVEHEIERMAFDVNMRNQRGNCPLHVAAFNGQVAIANYLLEKGADPLAVGQRNNTSLHFAAVKGCLELVQLFVNLGVSPLAKNENGKTPYDVAEGFGIKQFLMPLMFKEEQRTGTAPTILGATVDRSKEEARLANLAPPPKVGEIGMANPPIHENGSPTSAAAVPPMNPVTSQPFVDPNARVVQRPVRQIQPDGFVTTVNNPELAAKYGNHSTYRPTTNGTNSPHGAAPTMTPPTYSGGNKQNPFSKARYVQYDAINNSAASPVSYGQQQQPMASSFAPTAPYGNAAVWTPQQQDQYQQTQPSIQQQPTMQQQPGQQQPALQQKQQQQFQQHSQPQYLQPTQQYQQHPASGIPQQPVTQNSPQGVAQPMSAQYIMPSQASTMNGVPMYTESEEGSFN